MDRTHKRRTSMPSAVRVGGMSKSELAKALGEQSVRLNQAAEALFEDRRFTTLKRQQVIQIAALSVADLGLHDGGTFGEFTARALEAGLFECPLEMGPHLRTQFLDQPKGEYGIPRTDGRAPRGSFTVASSPLDDDAATPKGFYLTCVDGVLWLRGYWSSPDHVWSPEDVLVFSRGTAV
jgi:hypothetical protein